MFVRVSQTPAPKWTGHSKNSIPCPPRSRDDLFLKKKACNPLIEFNVLRGHRLLGPRDLIVPSLVPSDVELAPSQEHNVNVSAEPDVKG